MHNIPLAPLGSAQDILMQTLWLRHSQIRAFETLINIFANGLSINPEISKKINDLTNDYLELCLPGTKKAKENTDKEFIQKSSKTLKEITELLSKNYKGNHVIKGI